MIDRYNRAFSMGAEEVANEPFDGVMVCASVTGLLPVLFAAGGTPVPIRIPVGTTILPLAVVGFTATGKTGTYDGIYGLKR